MENAISEIMFRHLETIDKDENAEKAAKKMSDKHISSLLVVDTKKNGNDPVGIITERDFVSRVCAEGIKSSEVGVGQIMSSPIETIEETATIETAADLMLSNKIRHLLVVEEQTRRPLGIVAPSDLNKYLRANLNIDEVNSRILQAIETDEMSGINHPNVP